ncbi:Homeobox protein PKNOX1 [Tolypocladium capitatum]|uniref:Homeobox protein PKNOX1 n=1 Tax=Tolypocladium capitatum TaxID=45235 RepID=A0A2K3Q7L1_9HYPO|nr:Homeobox protein PKNOX1 [Tolypocladium capitatum]
MPCLAPSQKKGSPPENLQQPHQSPDAAAAQIGAATVPRHFHLYKRRRGIPPWSAGTPVRCPCLAFVLPTSSRPRLSVIKKRSTSYRAVRGTPSAPFLRWAFEAITASCGSANQPCFPGQTLEGVHQGIDRTTAALVGVVMDNSPTRHPDFNRNSQQNPTQQRNMSILTMATPSPHPIFRNEYPWDAARPSSDYSRPRAENRTVALPSIRQTFPELHLDGPLPERPTSRPSIINKSPSIAAQSSIASPQYVHSPDSNKRRRVSIEDEQSTLRAKQVPRLYRSPELPPPRQMSPARREHASSTTAETWTSPSRADSYPPSGGVPGPVGINGKVEPRHTLPSLPPTMKLDREPAPLNRPREPATAGAGALAVYQGPDYGYSYHHPSRYQSLSTSSIRPHDRAPFSAAGGNYDPHHQDIGRYGDLAGMGMGGDAKQRKRRGNLPKETTDKLRAWFVAHLQHPYPTEDEKQDLMRQTGLQMNQISNWFINARRRQLPAMINSARAESDAMHGRVGSSAGGEGKILASTERPANYGPPPDRRATALPLSDGEGGVYDEDVGSLRKRRAGELSRESV